MGIIDHVNVVINSGEFTSVTSEVDYDGMPYYVVVEPYDYVAEEGDDIYFKAYIYRNTHEEDDESVVNQSIPQVTYTLTGTATNGVDYELLTGVINFDPEQTFSNTGKDRRGHEYQEFISILEDVPIDDLETIILTINSSDNYIIGDPSAITDNSTPGTFTIIITDMSSPTYATLNPSDKHSSITLSNGNLTAAATASDGGGLTRLVRANMEMTTGKWYYEATLNSGTYTGAGIGASSASGMTVIANGSTIAFTHIYESGGGGLLDSYDNGNDGAHPYNGPFSAFGGLIVALLVDLDLETITLKNAVTGSTIVSGLSIRPLSHVPLVTFRNFFAGQITMNFGASAFTGVVPSGYHRGYGINVPIA